MSKYYDLSEDAIKTFNTIFKKKAFPVDVKFHFTGDSKQKNLIKVSKIPDVYAADNALGKELTISINEDLMTVFDEESVQILIEQEIDKISINIDNGKIKLIKPDLTTFSGLITKYGIEKVSKANQVEELYEQQKKDGTDDEFIV